MTTSPSESLNPGPWEKIHQELGVKALAYGDKPLGSFLEAHAESIPDNVALAYCGRNISYAELNTLTNRLANALVSLGVGRDDVIGLHMPNIPQYVITVLAASKIGAAVSGMSAMLAPMEIARQIEDAEIKVLFSLDSMAKAVVAKIDKLPECLTAVVVSSAEDFLQPEKLELPELEGVTCHGYLDIMENANSEYQQHQLPPDHVILIQYTGGTTGPAKGAQLTLGGTLLNAALSQVYQPWEVGQETVASALPLFHVAGMVMLTISLRYGGHFFLIPNPRDIEHFCQQMIDCPPTRISAVPTLYQQIVNHPLSKQIDFSRLTFAMTGSAPITGDDRVRIEKVLGGIVLSDSYGMTETGPAMAANPPERCKPESVGIPLPGVDVRIVDVETGTQELPYGEAGEIIVNTPCLMAGYLKRPEETAKAVREWRGKLWMHTGDVGEMDEEGYIYLRDRTKDMIIVSGFKVFSTEVENEVAALDCIANSALIGTPDTARPGSEIVNLYVEPTAAAKQRDADELRKEILDFCESNLARYKIPKLIHLIDEIPLTAVGKVDKKALRASAQDNEI